MARFYERYGYAILWSLTSILGIALLYWLIVFLATHGLLPDWGQQRIVALHALVSSAVQTIATFVEKHVQWFGALATLATFVFGLVTGIRQAKRQLPRRLMQFMTERLGSVYDNSEAIVGAIAYRSANVPHKARLFYRHPLNQALNSLGNAYRPRWRRSLDETITEVNTYIDVAEKRLQYLQDIRAHAHILRGAVRSAEGPKRNQADATSDDQKVEADFTAAMGNATSKLAALELRGLFRARLGSLPGALQDFGLLQTHAQEVFHTLGHARALRYQADILRKQAAGTNPTALRRARRHLNAADRLFDKDGRILDTDDWRERGHNRECYGEVQADLAAIAGTSKKPAVDAFNAAIGHFQRAGAACSADCDRVSDRKNRL
jgi:hypothetical protein